MARRLPLCAWCGGTLARQARVIMTWERLRPRPAIGWHGMSDCTAKDPIYNDALQCMRNGEDPRPLIQAIRERGRGRVRE